MIWFTADQHFNHKKIIGYCDRPFDFVADMNKTIIKNFQDRVGKSDICYHLGDFGFGSVDRLKGILSQLPGTHFLVRGNHDKKPNACINIGFLSAKQRQPLRIGNIAMQMSHRPILSYPEWADYVLHGHIHQKIISDKYDIRHINVGVDVHNFCPVSFEELKNG